MIRVKILPEVLSQLIENEDEYLSCVLMTNNGSLLGCSKPKEVNGRIPNKEHELVSDIASIAWSEFDSCGHLFLNQAKTKKKQSTSSLVFQLFDLENGKIGVMKTGNEYMICIYATSSACVGLLKSKLQAIGEYLAPILPSSIET